MGKFVIVFKKKYPKFKLGDHINLIFREGVDGGDTIKINGKTVPLLSRYRDGSTVPVDNGQFTIGNKYVGEWTSKGLEIYAGEFVKEEKPDPTKKTINLVKRGTDNWYPCLFTQFKIEKQKGGAEVNSLVRDTSYTIRLAKSVIATREFSGNTFAMLKYGDRVIPFLDRDKNYITTETLLGIMKTNTTGLDVNYATIQASYRVYFSRGSRILDGIEIEVPSNTASHTRYKDFPRVNTSTNDPYRYCLTKSSFVKNRLYAIPHGYAGTSDMHGNFNISGERLTFVDKFGKNWTDSKDKTTTNISKLLIFADKDNNLNVTKDFELCIPSKPNDGLFRTVSGDLALFCLPSLYDFTTSINIKTNGSIIDPLRYINNSQYGFLYRMHMDNLDLDYVHSVKANSSKVDKYSEWLLPHFAEIYKVMDNAVNDAPLVKFTSGIIYNGRNIYQVDNDFSSYKTINILARNKTATECATIVNNLAANLKKYKYKAIIRLIADNKVPYETLRDSLFDAGEYALYTRERITKEEALLIKYLPASIADDRYIMLERLRANNTDVLFPNIKDLNDFGMAQDCLTARPNHYFLYDLDSSRILDENSLYTVSFNGPPLDGVHYYLANDIADPQETWTEINRSDRLAGLRGKSIIAVFKDTELRYRNYSATITIKDEVYNITKTNTDSTPSGIITYRIIPQSGLVINTDVTNASDTGDNKWPLYVPGTKLLSFCTPTLITTEGNVTTRISIDGDGNILVPPHGKYKLELAIGNYAVNGTFTFGVADQTINVTTGNTTWTSGEYTITKAFDKVKINVTFEELLKTNEMVINKRTKFSDTDNLFNLYDITKMGANTVFTNNNQYKMVITADTIQAKDNGHAIVGIYYNDRIIPMVDGSRQYIRTSDLLAYHTSLGDTAKIPMTYKVLYSDANVTIDVFEIDYQSSYKRDKITEDTVFLVGCNRADYSPKYKYFKGNVLYAHKKLNPCNPTANNNEFFYKNDINPQCQIDTVNKTASITARYYSDFTTPLLTASHVVATIGRGATDINLNLELGSPVIKCAIESTSNNCNAIPYDLYGIGNMKSFQALYHTSGRAYMYRRSTMVDNMLWGYILNVDDYVNAMNGVATVATTDRISLVPPAFKYVFRRQDFKDGTYKESFTKIMGKLANLSMDNKNVQVYIANVDYMQDTLNISAEELMNLSKPAWNGSGNKVNLYITSFDDLDDTGIAMPIDDGSGTINFVSQANQTKNTRQRSTSDTSTPDIAEITGGSVWFDKKDLLTELFKPNDIITIICSRELRDADVRSLSDIDILNLTIKKTINDTIDRPMLFKLQGNPVGYYKIAGRRNNYLGTDSMYRMCYILLDDKYKIPLIDRVNHNYISAALAEKLIETDVYLEIRRFVPEHPAIKYPIYGAVVMNTITDKQMLEYNSLYYSKGDHVNDKDRQSVYLPNNYIVAVNTVPGTNTAVTSNALIADFNYKRRAVDFTPAIPTSGDNKFTYRTGEYIFNANLTNGLLAEDSAFESRSVTGEAIYQFCRIRFARNYGINQVNAFEPFLDNVHMRFTDSKAYKDTANIGVGTFLRTSTYKTQELVPQEGVNINSNDPVAGYGKNTYLAVPELFEPNLEYTNESGTTEWKSAYSTKLYKNGVVYDFFTHSCDTMYADLRTYAGMNLKPRIVNTTDKSREGYNGYPLLSQVVLTPHFDGVVHFYTQFLDDSVTVPTSISIGKSPLNVFVNRNSDVNYKNYVIYLDNIDDMNNNVNYITSFITKYYSQLRDDESVSIIVNNYAKSTDSSNDYFDNTLVKRANLDEVNTYISRINKVLKQELVTHPSKNLKISVHFTNSRYQVMGPWSNEYLSSSVNIVTANNSTGLEVERVANITQVSAGNTTVRNIFEGFNLTLNFLRKADFMQARNPKAFVGFKDPVIFESL